MTYSFEQLFAADPANPSNIAQNASITIFAPGDATMTPLAITDPDGTPLPNPLQVNANGFGSAFAHPTLDRVAWAGGGFTGFVTSYEGMKEVSLAAQTAAENAAAEAAAAGANAAAEAASALAEAVADAEAAQSAAESAASLVGAPADAAIAAAVNGSGTATKAALNAAFAGAATTPSSLKRWKVKLATDPANAKIVGMGDSTSDPATDAVTIWNRMKDFHTLPGEGLEGMTKANIMSFGHNGSKRSEWAANAAWKAEITGSGADLVIYSYGINDRRLGLTSVADLKAGIIADIDYLRAAMPNTDFILRTPNSFLSDDPGATGWVSPLGSAQQYSTDLQDIYGSLVGRWPNVVVWSAQDRVFGRKSKPLASNLGRMKDILHPSKEKGYPLIADRLVKDLIGHESRAVATTIEPVDMLQASFAAYPYVLGDLGDRADSTTAIGTASSGLAPTVTGGPAGLISRAVYVPSGALTNVYYNIGISDYECGATLVKHDSTSLNTHFVIRRQDSTNFVYLKAASGARWELMKIVGGVNTYVKTVIMPVNNGDRVAVRDQDDVISVFINDQLIICETVTEFSSSTLIGFQLSDAIVRWAHLWARRLTAR